jgi:hypothetical protein
MLEEVVASKTVSAGSMECASFTACLQVVNRVVCVDVSGVGLRALDTPSHGYLVMTRFSLGPTNSSSTTPIPGCLLGADLDWGRSAPPSSSSRPASQWPWLFAQPVAL